MKSRIAFAIAGLLFCAGTILWILLYGKADNSLHTSALSWSDSLAFGIFAGVGFGAVAFLIPAFADSKKTEPTQ
jgi:4-amino-4-deoxy-L-arabinose transferase-like glycosyltransferase